MNEITIPIAVFLVLIILTLLFKKKHPKYAYKKLDALFTPAERSFLGVLMKAVGEDAQVFGKVRVADVVTPEKKMSRSNWQTAFNKISRKHFDYVLCDKNDLSVLCVIELNDSSHNSKKRKARDLFLEGVCQSADLVLVQFTARATYNIQEVHNTLAPFLQNNRQVRSVKKDATRVKDKHSKKGQKLCPECSEVMLKKLAKRGTNSGQEFWACSAFPKCRHTESIKG